MNASDELARRAQDAVRKARSIWTELEPSRPDLLWHEFEMLEDALNDYEEEQRVWRTRLGALEDGLVAEQRSLVADARRRGLGWGSIAILLHDQGYNARSFHQVAQPSDCTTIHGTLVRRWALRNGIR